MINDDARYAIGIHEEVAIRFCSNVPPVSIAIDRDHAVEIPLSSRTSPIIAAFVFLSVRHLTAGETIGQRFGIVERCDSRVLEIR